MRPGGRLCVETAWDPSSPIEALKSLDPLRSSLLGGSALS